MILDQFQLHGRVAIVTGCNTGLGQGMARALAQAGADIVGINVAAPTETAEQVTSLGRQFLDLRANLADVGCIDGLLQQALGLAGHIDVLVNNAGIIRRDDALKFSEKDWDDVMDINVKSVFFFSQAVARQYIAQQSGGKIINIASMLSFQGGVRVPSYTASKSGVMGITRLMANEWAVHGINVNAIAPGYMATDNTSALARRREPQFIHSGADSSSSMGRGRRSGWAGGLSGLGRIELHQWLHRGC
jgi:2-deoxy-D-gluconate 3-dehydrogenase